MSEETKSSVKQFLVATNRPWNANDIANNFQNQHGKSAVVKALEELVASGEVIEKLNGKQKIFYISQEHFVVHEFASKELDERMEKFHATIAELKAAIKDKNEKLVPVEKRIPLADLTNIRDSLRSGVAELRKAIEDAEKRIPTETDMKRSLKIKKNHEKAVNEWKKRKRLCNDMISMITENYSKSKLMEECSIETDEMAEVSVPKLK